VRLGQVVSNLLTNAAKYTEIGGRITVEGTCEGGDVVLRVRDTGIGITPEMLPRVFDLFIQEPQALDRSQGGLGLGLPIVRSLVALHGGTVNAYSEGEGRGTEFTIRLPAAPLREDAPGNPLAARPLTAPQSIESRRVLIVDDNEDAVELLAESLELVGHVVRVAYDGPSALRVAATFVPEVALLDIGLPVMDGYELARRFREHPGLEHLRLVAVTGYGQDSDRQRSQKAGFNAHMVKPVQMAELMSVIRALTRSGGREE
jgi:CheY-like chemotaxis protein/anti-sigma regulatory factor (Ser/Thr protein kinase)